MDTHRRAKAASAITHCLHGMFVRIRLPSHHPRGHCRHFVASVVVAVAMHGVIARVAFAVAPQRWLHNAGTLLSLLLSL